MVHAIKTVYLLMYIAISHFLLTICSRFWLENHEPITEYKAQLPVCLEGTMMIIVRLHFQMSVTHYSSKDIRRSHLQHNQVDFIT